MVAVSAYPVYNNFGVNFDFDGKVVERVFKLSERITTTLFDAIRRESVEVEVGLQFDKILNSVNEQLLPVSLELKESVVRFDLTNKMVIECINKGACPSQEGVSYLELVSEILLTLLSNAERAVKGSIRKLEESGINRACVGETLGHLYGISEILIELGTLIEETSENVRLSRALHDKPLMTSANPRLNALLG